MFIKKVPTDSISALVTLGEIVRRKIEEVLCSALGVNGTTSS